MTLGTRGERGRYIHPTCDAVLTLRAVGTLSRHVGCQKIKGHQDKEHENYEEGYRWGDGGTYRVTMAATSIECSKPVAMSGVVGSCRWPIGHDGECSDSPPTQIYSKDAGSGNTGWSEIKAMPPLRPDWSWVGFFMGMAHYVATASKDPSTKTGSVIVDRERRVVSIGYNGFPRGVNDAPERYHDRPLKYKLIVHCEENAILNAPLGVRGCTLFSTKFPCSECAKVIIQSGIRAVVHATHGTNASDAAWAEDARISRMAMSEAGIYVWDENEAPSNFLTRPQPIPVDEPQNR